MAITWSLPIYAELPRTCKEARQGGMLSSVVQGIRGAARERMRTLSPRAYKHGTRRGLVDHASDPRLSQT